MRTFDWKWQKLILRIKTFIDLYAWKIQDNVTSSEVWNDSSRFCLFLSNFQPVPLHRFILGRLHLWCFLFHCSYSLLDPVGKSKDVSFPEASSLSSSLWVLSQSLWPGQWDALIGLGQSEHFLSQSEHFLSKGRRVGRECQLLLKLMSYLKEAEHKDEILSVRSQDCKCILYLLKGDTICTDKEKHKWNSERTIWYTKQHYTLVIIV